MPSKQRQILTQKQKQQQVLTPLQLQVVRLLELPLVELEEEVNNKIIENVALEEGQREGDEEDGRNIEESPDGEYDVSTGDGTDDGGSPEETMEDPIPDYSDDDIIIANNNSKRNVEVPMGDTGSFIEDLLKQIGEYNVDETTRFLLEYLIGSLNDNGFINKSLYDISNELAFYNDLDVSEKEVEQALHILQQFDPSGIGARDLKECLILQIDRKLSTEHEVDSQKRALLELERRVLADYYHAFINNNYEKIMGSLGISPSEMQAVKEGVSHLNPRPGIALNESSTDTVMTVIPDFIIETKEDDIQMWLNEGDVPPLHISRQYIEDLQNYENNKKSLSNRDKEGYIFLKKNMDDAKMFIDAIIQRRHTLWVTMKAIIELQREFFFTQDDDQLRPMILQDVANRTKLDISTVSRVCNSKYCTIDGCVYPLKYFFSRVRTNADGEDINVRKVKNEIQSLVDAEDKSKPLSDDAITQMLNDNGFNVKRRTVAKYRGQMKIPTARLRKEIPK